jgi:iron-sulfur cluster repair protein YtfE (RIC family)
MTNDTSPTAIDPTATVRDTMAQLPQTRDVFSRFGVDTCCGSGIPILDAAHRDGADLDGLLVALREAAVG